MTAKERVFCAEYLIDLNASAAALRAGYTPATAKNASEWIKPEHPTKPKLRAEIDRMMADRSKRTGINADRVIRELAKVAFANLADVTGPNGSLNRSASPDDLCAVACYKVSSTEAGDTREIRMHDKNRALELLAKHLGLLTENLRVEDVRPIILDDTGEDNAGK